MQNQKMMRGSHFKKIDQKTKSILKGAYDIIVLLFMHALWKRLPLSHRSFQSFAYTSDVTPTPVSSSLVDGHTIYIYIRGRKCNWAHPSWLATLSASPA